MIAVIFAVSVAVAAGGGALAFWCAGFDACLRFLHRKGGIGQGWKVCSKAPLFTNLL